MVENKFAAGLHPSDQIPLVVENASIQKGRIYK